MLIGGLLLLSALRMNETATKNTYQSQENLTVQQNMTAIIQTIQQDFRRIGYCRNPSLTSNPAYYILYGGADSIVFAADLKDTGTLNTVKWWLGARVQTPNPDTVRMLCRQVDNQTTLDANLGVTQFSMRYLDVSGLPIPPPYIPVVVSRIPQLIELTIRVEPTAAYAEPTALYRDTAYTQNFAYWRQTRLVSRNIKLNR
jgi:hypothetical protein